MNKSGTVFKACIAHHYWHYMDAPKRFFKIMIGDFKSGVVRHSPSSCSLQSCAQIYIFLFSQYLLV